MEASQRCHVDAIIPMFSSVCVHMIQCSCSGRLLASYHPVWYRSGLSIPQAGSVPGTMLSRPAFALLAETKIGTIWQECSRCNCSSEWELDFWKSRPRAFQNCSMETTILMPFMAPRRRGWSFSRIREVNTLRLGLATRPLQKPRLDRPLSARALLPRASRFWISVAVRGAR